ncbi:MAG: hypothetical protein AB1609_20630 [Bacillota bacterium]
MDSPPWTDDLNLARRLADLARRYWHARQLAEAAGFNPPEVAAPVAGARRVMAAAVLRARPAWSAKKVQAFVDLTIEAARPKAA